METACTKDLTVKPGNHYISAHVEAVVAAAAIFDAQASLSIDNTQHYGSSSTILLLSQFATLLLSAMRSRELCGMQICSRASLSLSCLLLNVMRTSATMQQWLAMVSFSQA